MRWEAIQPYVRFSREQTFPEPARLTGYDHRLFLCTAGGGQAELGGRILDIRPGVLLFWRAGIPYRITSRPDTPLKLLGFNFDLCARAGNRQLLFPVPPEEFQPKRLTETEPVEDMPLLDQSFSLERADWLLDKFQAVHEEFTARRLFYEQRCSALVLDILTLAVRAAVCGQSAKSNQTIEDLLEYIRTHYQKPLSNQALAARFSYHPNHLSKLMVQYTGMSLHQYLLHVRITAAAQLLRSGDTAVSEAARAVGFESLSHFSRLFKQRIGCSPARYKEAAGI